MSEKDATAWADAKLTEICAATWTLPPKRPDPLHQLREDCKRAIREAYKQTQEREPGIGDLA